MRAIISKARRVCWCLRDTTPQALAFPLHAQADTSPRRRGPLLVRGVRACSRQLGLVVAPRAPVWRAAIWTALARVSYVPRARILLGAHQAAAR